MFDQEMKSDKQAEMEAILEEFEKVQTDNVRELFKVSRISREHFTYGILELSKSEQKTLVDGMLRDRVLGFLLHEELRNWEEIPSGSKAATLETAYDVLDVGSKFVWIKEGDSIAATVEEDANTESYTLPDLYKHTVKNSVKFKELQKMANETMSGLKRLIKTVAHTIDELDKDTVEMEIELVSTIYGLTEKLDALNKKALFAIAKKAEESTPMQIS